MHTGKNTELAICRQAFHSVNSYKQSNPVSSQTGKQSHNKKHLFLLLFCPPLFINIMLSIPESPECWTTVLRTMLHGTGIWNTNRNRDLHSIKNEIQNTPNVKVKATLYIQIVDVLYGDTIFWNTILSLP